MHKKNIVAEIDNKTRKLLLSKSNIKCLLPISMQQKYHYGDFFSSIIDLVNVMFDTCHIVICDSLHRHTLMLNNTNRLESAYNQAMQFGHEWLERHRNIIDALSIPTCITRWDHWIDGKSYLRKYNQLKFLYENNDIFKAACNEDVNNFLDRYLIHNKNILKLNDHCTEYPLHYLLEECAVISSLWNKIHYDCILYPGQVLQSMDLAIQEFINVDRTVVLWGNVRFKSYQLGNVVFCEKCKQNQHAIKLT